MKTSAALLGTFALTALTACGEGGEPQPDADANADAAPANTETDMEQTSLQAALDERQAQWAQGASEETISIYDRGVAAVSEAGVPQNALKAGDAAPQFTLPDANGDDVALSTLLSDGPVVVVFYRGAWCPYCNLTLAAWQERLDEIKGLGGQLVAISPQTPDYSLTTAERNELAFHVLSDVGHSVADQFGVTQQVTDEVLAIWEGRIDLAEHNDGDESGRLPLPATFLIDADGQIAFAHVHEDYRVRAEPQDVIDVLRGMQ